MKQQIRNQGLSQESKEQLGSFIIQVFLFTIFVMTIRLTGCVSDKQEGIHHDGLRLDAELRALKGEVGTIEAGIRYAGPQIELLQNQIQRDWANSEALFRKRIAEGEYNIARGVEGLAITQRDRTQGRLNDERQKLAQLQERMRSDVPGIRRKIQEIENEIAQHKKSKENTTTLQEGLYLFYFVIFLGLIMWSPLFRWVAAIFLGSMFVSNMKSRD